MFLKCFLINHVQITILMIPMFLCSCAEKKKRKKTCRPLRFQGVLTVTESVDGVICTHKMCYIHFIHNMLTFVSLVVFWRYFRSKTVWFIKFFFHRFLNLSLAIFLTCFLIFFFAFWALCFLNACFLK